jgi:hypothetical protein
MPMPTLTMLPEWREQLLPHVRLTYDLKIVRKGKPRIRIAADPSDGPARARLLAVRCACAACGREISPFRETHARAAAPWQLYVSVTCGYREGRFGCGHSAHAHVEYERIRAAVEGLATPGGTQARLAL